MSDATPKRSRRGVYYELSMSPYEFKSPYGDLFKFSSAKKLEIYSRDVEKEITRFNKIVERYNLMEYVPEEIIELLRRAVYTAFYNRVER